MTTGAAAIVAAAALLAVALQWVLVVPGGLAPRLLRPSPPRRLVRLLRAGWLRLVTAVLSWPRLVDVAFGVRSGRPGSLPLEVVWTSGRARLWRARPADEARPPVLIVHSVVTHPWILDLDEGASLVGSLTEAGLDPWVLSWGTATTGGEGLAWHVDRLLEAEGHVASATSSRLVHLLGYCAGGLVVLERLGSASRDPIGSVTLLATPVDLQEASGLQRLLVSPRFRPAWVLDGRGLVPAAVVREGFHLLRPEALRAQWRRWRRRGDAAYRRRYAAMGRWLWEQVPVPGALLFDLVARARSNAFVQGDALGDAPVLAVVAERDHIVPVASATAAADLGSQVEVVRVRAGHVAMVAGPATAEVVAPAVAAHVAAAGARRRLQQ